MLRCTRPESTENSFPAVSCNFLSSSCTYRRNANVGQLEYGIHSTACSGTSSVLDLYLFGHLGSGRRVVWPLRDSGGFPELRLLVVDVLSPKPCRVFVVLLLPSMGAVRCT